MRKEWTLQYTSTKEKEERYEREKRQLNREHDSDVRKEQDHWTA